jgi:hypothetical protein
MEHVEPVGVKAELTELDLEGIDNDQWGFPSITALYHKMVERLESNFPAKRELVRYVQMW